MAKGFDELSSSELIITQSQALELAIETCKKFEVEIDRLDKFRIGKNDNLTGAKVEIVALGHEWMAFIEFQYWKDYAAIRHELIDIDFHYISQMKMFDKIGSNYKLSGVDYTK